jgi:hypothetical protein
MKYIGIIIISFLFSYGTLQGQNWTVNPADYEFSMNITGQVVLDQGQINNENAMLGAFVGSECVGVTQPTEHEGSFDLFFITVYSNSSSGNFPEFKLLDSESQEFDLETEVMFSSNAIIGSADQPFIWMETETYASTDFLSFSHPMQTDTADINPLAHEISLVVDHQSNLTDFSPQFELAPGAKAYVSEVLQVSGESSLNFSDVITYHVTGVDGASADWQVSVQMDENSVNLIEVTGVSVFPNPATNYVEIKIPYDISLEEISLVNVVNQVLLKFNKFDGGSLRVPLNQLPDGIYIVKFSLTDHRVFQTRLIKQ